MKHIEEFKFDEYYLRVMMNCALGMINDIEFGKMFIAVETNSEYLSTRPDFEVSSNQIAAIALFLIDQLVDGDEDGMDKVLKLMSRCRTIEVESKGKVKSSQF